MEPYLKASTDRGIDYQIALGIIARRINNEWAHRVQAALDSIEERQSNFLQSTGVQLLSDVRNVVYECNRSEQSSCNLYSAAVLNEENEWQHFDCGHPITKKKFIQMLGDFGIKPSKRSNANIFYFTDVEDAFFLLTNPHLERSSTSSTCSIGGGCGSCGGFRIVFRFNLRMLIDHMAKTLKLV